jgi:ligand-binding sensor domain-containing protein
MKKLLFSFIAFLLVSGSMVNAQFTNYTTTDGLPSNYICGGVAIDTNNHVWAGTDAGVVTFDGTDWTVFTTADGLPVDIISCIAVDKNNNVWIGTDGDGVAKYNGTTWTTYNYSDGLCDNGIHYIAGAPDGSVWFASWGMGVSKLAGTSWSTYKDSLPLDQGFTAAVYHITFDGSGNVWFSTYNGASKYDGTNFTTVNPMDNLAIPTNSITAMAIDGSDNKWFGIQDYGPALEDYASAWSYFDTTNTPGLDKLGIVDIKTDSYDNIWFGVSKVYGALIKGGITLYHGNYWKTFSTNEGLGNEQVIRIAVDQNDDIWIATGNGLSKFHYDNVGISENNNDPLFDVYPNPVQDYLNINCTITSGVLEISDITGRTVATQNISSAAKISTENLVNGIYFISITEGNTVYNGKFIKE